MTTTTTVTCDECQQTIERGADRVTAIINQPSVMTMAITLDYHPEHAPQWAIDAIEGRPNGA